MLHRVITIKFLAVFLAVNAFAVTGLSQEETKEKTFTRSELDAILVAGRFSREMQRTKDLRPLIAKYGVPDYGLGIRQSKGLIEMDFLSPEFAAKVNPQSIRELHIAFSNFFYLHTIWSLHQVDEDDEFPPTVAKILESDPYLSETVNAFSEQVRINSSRDLSKTIKRLERAASIYRKFLERFPRVKTKTYLSKLADITDEGEELYQPNSHTCDKDDECLGLAVGTKFFEVTIEPRYIVGLVRVAGRMKIFYIAPYMD